MSQTKRAAGRLLVDQLRVQGAELAFTVPGESFLPVLDGFYDVKEVKLVVCRHEANAANMAEACGKITNRPGICFVTRGPGATQAAVGVHTAFQDSTPMILFIGDVGGDFRDREAFQEVDFSAMFGPLAKWAARIDRAERIPEYVHRAFQVATSGRRGPVVLALPEDMLWEKDVAAADARRYVPAEAHPGAESMERLHKLLAAAKSPLVILGGSGWTREACNDMQRFAEANHLPVACAFRFQDLLDNNHDHYVGDVGIAINPVLAGRIKQADLLLVAGARLGEMTTSGYTLVEPPIPRQKLVHVHAGADEIGRVYQPELGILASPAPFARAAAALPAIENPPWKASVAEARQDYLAWTGRREIPGRVQMWDIVDYLNKQAPDAIYTNGAGNFATWVHRFHRYTGLRSQLGPTSGAMGYGVPAAIAAKLARPERTVICFAGDGDFLMSGQELATAVQYDAPVIVLILNNGMYGTIRMHQEKEYPGRVSGTEIQNPHFAAFARSFGCVGEIVEDTAQFAPAFERCLASGKPAVIDVKVDPQAITPNITIDKIRASALAARK